MVVKSLTLAFVKTVVQNLERKTDPLSEIMLEGMPHLLTTLSKKTCAHSLALYVSFPGARMIALLNLSVMDMIESYTFPAMLL